MDTGDGYLFSLHVQKPVHAILLIFKQVKHQYNLQYFSWHYHHYNERYISKFWQVRNPRLPFHLLLAKITFWQVCWLVMFVTCQNYHFGKYVRWSCLSVCLLLAKIYNFGKYVRLTVCLFVTCQNLQFWQVCSFNGLLFVCLLLAKISQKFGKYVRLTVCLSVCLSVTRYSSQFLTNQHQTWSIYVVWYKDQAYSFSRSKVK